MRLHATPLVILKKKMQIGLGCHSYVSSIVRVWMPYGKKKKEKEEHNQFKTSRSPILLQRIV